MELCLEEYESRLDHIDELTAQLTDTVCRDQARIILHYAGEEFGDKVSVNEFTVVPSANGLELAREGLLTAAAKAIITLFKAIWKYLVKAIGLILKPVSWLIGDVSGGKGFSGGSGGSGGINAAPETVEKLKKYEMTGENLVQIMAKAEENYNRDGYMGRHVSAIGSIANNIERLAKATPQPIYDAFKKNGNLLDSTSYWFKSNKAVMERYKTLIGYMNRYPFIEFFGVARADVYMQEHGWEDRNALFKMEHFGVDEEFIEALENWEENYKRLMGDNPAASVKSYFDREIQLLANAKLPGSAPDYNNLTPVHHVNKMAKMLQEDEVFKKYLGKVPDHLYDVERLQPVLVELKEKLKAKGGYFDTIRNKIAAYKTETDVNSLKKILPGILTRSNRAYDALNDAVINTAKLNEVLFTQGNPTSASYKAYRPEQFFTGMFLDVIKRHSDESFDALKNDPSKFEFGTSESEITDLAKATADSITNLKRFDNLLTKIQIAMDSEGSHSDELINYRADIHNLLQVYRTRDMLRKLWIPIVTEELTLYRNVQQVIGPKVNAFYRQLEELVIRLYGFHVDREAIQKYYRAALIEVGIKEKDADELCEDMEINASDLTATSYRFPKIIESLLTNNKFAKKYKIKPEELRTALASKATDVVSSHMELMHSYSAVRGVKGKTVDEVTKVFMASLRGRSLR